MRALLQAAAELAVQRLLGQVGDVRGHARDGEPVARHLAVRVIVAAAPVRIGHDGLAADLVEGDVLRGMPGGRRDRHGAEHAVGVARGPFQHLHAAHRSADDAEQLVDAEVIDQAHLRIDHVADGDDGEVEAVGLARARVDRGGPRRAHAAAEDVGADDEEAVGVDRLAGADERRPPAGLAGHRVLARDVLVARQRVADEDGVGLVGVERAVGLVGDARTARATGRRRAAAARSAASATTLLEGLLASARRTTPPEAVCALPSAKYGPTAIADRTPVAVNARTTKNPAGLAALRPPIR